MLVIVVCTCLSRSNRREEPHRDDVKGAGRQRGSWAIRYRTESIRSPPTPLSIISAVYSFGSSEKIHAISGFERAFWPNQRSRFCSVQLTFQAKVELKPTYFSTFWPNQRPRFCPVQNFYKIKNELYWFSCMHPSWSSTKRSNHFLKIVFSIS
jgi:hypothetical protein